MRRQQQSGRRPDFVEWMLFTLALMSILLGMLWAARQTNAHGIPLIIMLFALVCPCVVAGCKGLLAWRQFRRVPRSLPLL